LSAGRSHATIHIEKDVPGFVPIEQTDRQIDALVCELYGLSEKEIQIVEDATK
jgi:hypothetical protein